MGNIKKNRKITVGVFFGGRSFEHEVSIVTGRAILGGIDRDKYCVQVYYLSQDGKWLFLPDPSQLVGQEVTVASALSGIDVAIPALHGPKGEDGAIQGLFELFGVPYVGCGVAASSLCYDKVFSKHLFAGVGLNVVPYATFNLGQFPDYEQLKQQFGPTLFVKPANTGCSVGVSKVNDRESLQAAVELAKKYDDKIVIEKAIFGREIELAVLGNEDLVVSLPGEIIPKEQFYSYEAKYLDPEGALLVTPAEMEPSTTCALKKAAIQAFKACGCQGLSRVDFLIDTDGTIYTNEINTFPGFTPISLYPKLMAVEGYSYAELIEQLIRLAFDSHKRKSSLLTSRVEGAVINA